MIEVAAIVVTAIVVLVSISFGYFLGITRNPRNPNE